MTVLLAVQTALLVVLTVLVAGLLRAYATVLRRLHELDGGRAGARAFQLDLPADVGSPTPREDWTQGHDLAGETVTGELVSTRVVGVEHDTALVFLSSGCESCATFWTDLARPARLPLNTRLVVVTQGDDAEDRHAVASLAGADLEVVMSSGAWQDYEVPGSPHVVFVEGRTGRVRGGGTGESWEQVAQLLARASGDPALLGGTAHAAKPARDAEAERAVDRELMAAGILPGDPRLYGGAQ